MFLACPPFNFACPCHCKASHSSSLHRHTDTQTHTQTHRHTQTHTHTHTDTHTHTHRHTHRHTDTQTHTKAHTDTQTHTKAHALMAHTCRRETGHGQRAAVASAWVAAATVLTVALICPAIGESYQDWPPAPDSGGAKCTINAECGIPAANCESLRDKCASLTGSCTNSTCVFLVLLSAMPPVCVDRPLFSLCLNQQHPVGFSMHNVRCTCAANMYGCPNCHAKAVLDRDPKGVHKNDSSTIKREKD